MKVRTVTLVACAAALFAVGCYEFVSQSVVSNTARPWTGAAVHYPSIYPGVIGLAGQDVYLHHTFSWDFWDDPLLDEFGGPYVLTSAAQTHNYYADEDHFVHGNLVGETDNLSLLYSNNPDFADMDWVAPWSPTVDVGSLYYDIVEICDLAAVPVESSGSPSDVDSHLFMSFRACHPVSTTSCVGGVMEIDFDSNVDFWWPEFSGSTEQSSIRRTNGSSFSNECMPIAVTSRGDQTKQYLVVGDPSLDEFTLFDAAAVGSGPIDSLRPSEPNRQIVDIAVEGRGDGSVDYMFMATLWKGVGGSKIDHRVVANGQFSADPPFLTEPMPDDVVFISSSGRGAEGSSGELYTFGAKLMRRNYSQ